MSKDQVNIKAVNKGIDAFWDSWLEGVKKFNDLQNDFEKQSLKTFNDFDQFFKPTNTMLKKTEEESLRLTKETNEKLKASFRTITNGHKNPVQVYWLKQIEEVSEQTQSLFWSSNKALIDFISISQEKMAENMESLLKEQQTGRAELVKKISDLIEEIKSAQKDAIPVK